MISSPPTLPPPPPPPKTPSMSMLNQFGQFNLPSPPALPPPAVSPPYPTLLLSPKSSQMTSSLLLATTDTPSKRLNEMNDNTHSTHQLNSFGRSNTLDRKPRSTFSYEAATKPAKSRIDTPPQNSYFSNSLERSQPHGAEYMYEYQAAELVCTSPQRNSLNLVLKSPSSPPTCRVIKTNSVYTKRPVSQETIMENAAYLVGFQNQPKLHLHQHQHTASTPTSPEFIISAEFGTQGLKHELEAATCQIHKLNGQLHASVRVVFSNFKLK